ncbi:MAG TPA: hypothetical protein VKU00_12360 [Chthonomonadaceae bacterium]|nr:hypothetical protein [Chthonomonadaceae bacterium]
MAQPRQAARATDGAPAAPAFGHSYDAAIGVQSQIPTSRGSQTKDQ